MAKNRPLRAVRYRLDCIDDLIGAIIDKEGCATVLEVGCGFGLPMLELKKKFGDNIQITGINKDQKFNLPKKALWEGVRQLCFWPWDPLLFEHRYGFPMYVNCDASLDLPFPDNSFDLIYSIATTFFLKDKLHFLREVNRVLRPDRVARIHFSHSAKESCHPVQLPAPPYDNLCEIRDASGQVLDVVSFFSSFDFLKIVEQGHGRPSYLQLRKMHDSVDFGATLSEGFFLNDFNPEWVAYARSVYVV